MFYQAQLGLPYVTLTDRLGIVTPRGAAAGSPVASADRPSAAMNGATIVVLGGSGFVGRHLVARLVADGPPRRRSDAQPRAREAPDPAADGRRRRGRRARSRRRSRAWCAAPRRRSIWSASSTNRGRGDFDRVHVELPRKLIAACRDAAVTRLLHMSALNADPQGPSRYLRSKGEAEALVAASGLQWTIFQPSVIFGREDSLPQPVRQAATAAAGDCAGVRRARASSRLRRRRRERATCARSTTTRRTASAIRCAARRSTRCASWSRYVGELTGYRRPIVALGPALSKLQAARARTTCPGKLMSRDNLAFDAARQRLRLPVSVAASAVPAALALEAIAPDRTSRAARRAQRAATTASPLAIRARLRA